MKKHIYLVIVFAAFLIGTATPVWGQASTQGKEFWVALNMTTGTGGNDHKPFICITTQHQGGSYTITNPADPTFKTITGQIPLNGYIKIEAKEDNLGPNDIDLSKWYPIGQTAQTVSNQIKNVGLKITTTVECSVFAGNRLPQSFDAANILPITTLQTDYITQDYPGYDHEDKGGGHPVTTILATKDKTHVTIVPSSSVLNNTPGTATITKTLNAGQVLYLTGENRASLSGTSITSDQKIAVFTGVNNTDVPGPVSARDHLYEQNMPIDYWGTHFVVTRSMKKDANRIRVTAKENGTSISVDGYEIATINSGETYEFELSSAVMRTEEGYTKAATENRGCDYSFEDYAHYLETSCPCAVFSYDVSENYYIKKNGTSERDENAHGDPSMVWISPLEQQLRKVTFGVMNTDKTPTHYVNIITPTKGASTLEVREIAANAGQVVYGNNMVQPSDIQPVPGNPTYSYARIKLVENSEKVYTITSGVGFIAHVYGSGDKESYAYSCGSAAVQQGVRVNEETFVNGYRSEDKFCFDQDITFDARVGTDEITRVDWNFGDGTSQIKGEPQTSHKYTSPGWYDVTANLYGHQVCTDESEQPLGSVSFSFRVVRADTVIVDPGHYCFSPEEYAADKAGCDKLIAEGKNDTLWDQRVNCYDTVKIQRVVYGIDTEYEYDAEGRDSALVNGQWYYSSQDVQYTIPNKKGCDSIITCHLKVITCLGLSFNNDSANQHACYGESLALPYVKTKGDIGKVRFVIPGVLDEEVEMDNANTESGTLEVPTNIITKPGKYVAQLQVEDAWCDPLTYKFDIAVYYPSDVFAYKFNNVLAVYKPGKGGNKGWNFNAYQWYRNGEPITGATESVYHLDGIFVVNDEVYVVLTDNEGIQLPSCPITIETVPDFNSQAAVQKRLVNKQMVIQHGNRIYNLYGQRIQ